MTMMSVLRTHSKSMWSRPGGLHYLLLGTKPLGGNEGRRGEFRGKGGLRGKGGFQREEEGHVKKRRAM